MPTGYSQVQTRSKNDLGIDNNQYKWICFQTIGLGKYDGVNWIMYDIANSGMPSNKALCIDFDNTNAAWIGTDSGLVKFDGTAWTIYNTSNSSIPGNNVNTVEWDGNKLWIGTNSGLANFNGSVWNAFTTSNSSLPNDTVQSIAFESAGITWVGTKNRLGKLNGSTWTSFGTSNSGLLSNNVLSLYWAGNDLWIGTRGGGIHKMFSNTISNLSVFHQSPAFTYLNDIYSITRGPLGGVLFSVTGLSSNWNNISGSSIALAEYLPWQERIAMYYPGTLVNNALMEFNPQTGNVWFVSKLSMQYINLYDFNRASYVRLGLGLTADNTKNLDINEVSAIFLNQGDFHWNLSGSGGYEVPKGSGKTVGFASSLWMGGLDFSGTLHLAAMTYRQTGSDYWPGPLDTIAGATFPQAANAYDKIWKINKQEVDEFIYQFAQGNVQSGAYVPDFDIINWPAHGTFGCAANLAPFVDVNSNGVYEPLTAGDYPKIKGDQMLYWIFNDNLLSHSETGGVPLKVEVRASAYAFACPTVSTSDKVINSTTYYNFQIINRSNLAYDSMYVGYWQDVDIGTYSDDYVSCIPQENFAMAYNGSSFDQVYGNNPPLFTNTLLKAPLAVLNDGVDNDNDGSIDEPGERGGMASFATYNNDWTACCGNPSTALEFYHYLKGEWKDGSPYLCNSNPTTYAFSGWPYDINACTENNIPNTPADRRYLHGSGPYDLAPGDTLEFDYALIFSWDSTLAYGTIPYYMQIQTDVDKVQNWFSAYTEPSCLPYNVSVSENKPEESFITLFPNPTSGDLYVALDGQVDVDRIFITDIAGKILFCEKSKLSSSVHLLHTSELASGVYFVTVSADSGTVVKKFIKN